MNENPIYDLASEIYQASPNNPEKIYNILLKHLKLLQIESIVTSEFLNHKHDNPDEIEKYEEYNDKSCMSKLGISLKPYARINKTNTYYNDKYYSIPDPEEKLKKSGEKTRYSVYILDINKYSKDET